MTVSNNSVNIGHCSMKLNLTICSTFSMWINVNIPTRPILDESDMCVANPDITTWQPSFSLFTRLWTACCGKLNNRSSGCRPKCCDNQSEKYKNPRSSLSRPSTRSLLLHIPTPVLSETPRTGKQMYSRLEKVLQFWVRTVCMTVASLGNVSRKVLLCKGLGQNSLYKFGECKSKGVTVQRFGSGILKET